MNTCTIVNDWFSWELQVDGTVVTFNGLNAAEYFEAHYSKLGYLIVKKQRIKGPHGPLLMGWFNG